MTTPRRAILLVDDNPNDIQLISLVLGEVANPHEVVVAEDGEEGLDFLYRRGRFGSRLPAQPVLVLLDVKMPKVDGIEVLRTVKKDPNLREVPVVMLTSSREVRDVRTCYELGANGYVVKPVDFSAFRTAVQKLGDFWTTINEPPPG